MLITINEIEVKLNEKFSPFNGEMEDLILKKKNIACKQYQTF